MALGTRHARERIACWSATSVSISARPLDQAVRAEPARDWPADRRLILGFGIERAQPFGLGGMEKTLVGGDQDEVVAMAASVLGESQHRVQDDRIGRVHRMILDVDQCRDDEAVRRLHAAGNRSTW